MARSSRPEVKPLPARARSDLVCRAQRAGVRHRRRSQYRGSSQLPTRAGHPCPMCPASGDAHGRDRRGQAFAYTNEDRGTAPVDRGGVIRRSRQAVRAAVDDPARRDGRSGTSPLPGVEVPAGRHLRRQRRLDQRHGSVRARALAPLDEVDEHLTRGVRGRLRRVRDARQVRFRAMRAQGLSARGPAVERGRRIAEATCGSLHISRA